MQSIKEKLKAMITELQVSAAIVPPHVKVIASNEAISIAQQAYDLSLSQIKQCQETILRRDKMIIDLNLQLGNRWVPVCERLPYPGQYVNFLIEHSYGKEEVLCGQFEEDRFGEFAFHTVSHAYYLSEPNYQVISWQPLPPAPDVKPKEEEK
jgi:hypothetical protein